jgi:hypothetical protein
MAPGGHNRLVVRHTSSQRKSPLPAERANEGGIVVARYEPFWQTVSDSPWKVNSPFTDVLGGAPK